MISKFVLVMHLVVPGFNPPVADHQVKTYITMYVTDSMEDCRQEMNRLAYKHPIKVRKSMACWEVKQEVQAD
jgi:hypothetical protein